MRFVNRGSFGRMVLALGFFSLGYWVSSSTVSTPLDWTVNVILSMFVIIILAGISLLVTALLFQRFWWVVRWWGKRPYDWDTNPPPVWRGKLIFFAHYCENFRFLFGKYREREFWNDMMQIPVDRWEKVHGD